MAPQGNRKPIDVTQPEAVDKFEEARVASHKMLGEAALPSPSRQSMTVAQRLFQEGFFFDFFQATRLLEKLQPHLLPVGRSVLPEKEIVRLRPRLSLEFPASAIHEVLPPSESLSIPTMIVAFMGLTGSSGVLPRNYTELLMRQAREVKHAEKYALRDWFDLFNHRLISLFYRAWEKYRFYIPYERAEYDQPEPDPFTQGLFSLIGIGIPSIRNRLRISYLPPDGIEEKTQRVGIQSEKPREKVLGKIDDLALLRFSGFLAHRPRNAVSLQVILSTYLQIPVEVQQFQGQWLRLEPDNQSSLGTLGLNNGMGVNALIGDRIWDVQSKIRLRLGPLTYAQFVEFLPDPTPVTERKAQFLLLHLVRLYVGMEIDVEVQLVLRAGDVPKCRMGKGEGPIGSRIGWNSWSRAWPKRKDAEEPVFAIRERVFINAAR